MKLLQNATLKEIYEEVDKIRLIIFDDFRTDILNHIYNFKDKKYLIPDELLDTIKELEKEKDFDAIECLLLIGDDVIDLDTSFLLKR